MTHNSNIPTDPEARAWTWIRQCAQLRRMYQALADHDAEREATWRRLASIVGGFLVKMTTAIEAGTDYDVIERHARYIVVNTDVHVPEGFDPTPYIVPELQYHDAGDDQ